MPNISVIAVFIGSFTLTLTSGLGSGISAYIDKQVANIGARNVMVITAGTASATSSEPQPYDPARKVATSSDRNPTSGSVLVLTDADITKLRALPGIIDVEPSRSVAPDYLSGPNGKNFQTGVSRFISGTKLSLDAGQLVEVSAPGFQVDVPSSYISLIGFNSAQDAVGKSVTIGISSATGQQSTVTALVRGVQQKSLVGGTGLTVNGSLLDELYRLQNAGLPVSSANRYQFAAAHFDPNFTPAQIASLKQRLKTGGYTGQTVDDQIGTFKAVISGIIGVLDAFAVIALLAAGFGIINTLLMSVQERTREIGLMKAMGMSGGRIFALFSLEAVALGLLGSGIGVVVAEIVRRVANHIVTTTYLKDLAGLQLLAFPVSGVALIIGLVVAISFLAGTLPAYKAARQNPIDSLRYE